MLEKIPFPVVFTGYITDDLTLSKAYQSADLFVSTSIQDSGPMMVNESIMCGTPVVAFEVGVVPDLVKDGVSGYRVPVMDTAALSKNMAKVLELNKQERNELELSTYTFAHNLTSFNIFNKNFEKDFELRKNLINQDEQLY
jgi:glycosyltransferase involved in cell wall biosynthesis